MRLTAAEVARILGCSRNHVYRLTRQQRLPRDGEPHKWGGYDLETVETVSLAAFARRRRRGHPYWATVAEAAEILGVTRTRVRQLARAGRIPAVAHDGAWVFRREQLEVVANAREVRRLDGA